MSPTRYLGLLVVVSLAGCKKESAPVEAKEAAVVDAGPAAPAKPARAEKPVELTFLITGAENGYLLPTADLGVHALGAAVGAEGKQTLRGGAAEILGRWTALEGHCAGPLGPDGASACPDGGTVVLSTGDNGNGQAISSFFKGEPTAELMRAMGYAASALGNRELDWPREQFLANAAKGGFPYLAANLKAKDDEGGKLGLLPWRVVTRRGVKVGIVGLAARKATVTPMPGRMAGIELVPDEAALSEAVTAVRQAGATVVVVVGDGCLNEAPPLFEAHPEWKVAFYAARQCDDPFPEVAGATRLVYPGRHFNSYARVTVVADTAKTGPDQLFSVEPASVEVVSGPGQSAPDPKAAELVAAWKKKLDAALGEPIGFTKDGIEQDSAQMSSWLTTALREQFKTDTALLNRRGVRQGLPPGAVTKESIYDLAPFANQVVIVKVNGEALLGALGNVEARISGLKPRGEGFVDAAGADIDPKKVYTMATLDYLYLGGDGFTLNKADPSPTQTNVPWQTALIEWTKARKSDAKKPLETMIHVK